MRRFLDRVGVSQVTLDNIANVVQSCPVCREWAKPGSSNQSSTSVPDQFNQQVEADLMEVNNLYNEDHRILHLVDRCTRWQATAEVLDKKEETLMNAIERIWVGIFVPPKRLISLLNLGTL